MGISLDPTQWHKQKSPEEWQAINKKAMQDFHASLAADPSNPDREALQAIKDSNDAMNAYDKPAITAGEHTLKTGWGDPVEALKGEVRGAAGAVEAPFHLANTMYRQGSGAAVDELLNGIKSMPDMIKGGDPEQIGELAGNTAGGIAMGRLGAKLVKGGSGIVSEFAERPRLKNALLRAQTESAQNNAAKSGAILPDAIEQSGLRTKQMSTNLDKSTGTLEDLTRRPGLQNELTELQIEKLRKGLEGNDNAGPSGSAPVSPKSPSSGPNDILDPRDQAKADFAKDDPYGLNDLKNTKAPDNLNKDIMDKLSPLTGQQIPPIDNIKPAMGPADLLARGDNSGLAKPSNPLSPVDLDQLLKQIGIRPNTP